MGRNDYGKITDEELIARLHGGDEAVVDFLMEKYKNLVKSKAKAMFILGADNDDLIQEGMIGLFKAIRDYSADREAGFKTFANLCISRQMYTAVNNSRRKKHSPLNSYVSIYSNLSGEGEESEYLENLISIADRSPEELLIDNEQFIAFEEAIYKVLSPLEKQVIELTLTGMEYTEIAGVLNRDDKSIDNALQRIKGKIRKILGEKHNG